MHGDAHAKRSLPRYLHCESLMIAGEKSVTL